MRILKTAIATCAALLTLTACSFSNNHSPDSIKGKLNGYEVNVCNMQQGSQTETAKTFPEKHNMTSHLSAAEDADSNYLFAWFFDNIDNASKWSQEYLIELADVRPPKSDVTFTQGSNNNVVWVGTIAAAKVAGLSS